MRRNRTILNRILPVLSTRNLFNVNRSKKKTLSLLIAATMLFGLFNLSLNALAEPEPSILTQEIECIPTPNWNGDGGTTLIDNINKYMEIYKANGMQTDERQYIVPELSNYTEICPIAIWNFAPNAITRFMKTGSIVYKYDLANTTTDFSFSVRHGGFGFTVEASNDGSTWLPIGEGPAASVGYVSTNTFPQALETAYVTNMNTVLQNNSEKTVYIKLTCKPGGELIYQSVKITAHYPETDESTATLKCSLVSTPDNLRTPWETDNAARDARYYYTVSKSVLDEAFLFEKSSPMDSNLWGGNLVSFMSAGQYKTYKFDLDPRAVDFTVGLRGCAYGSFTVEASKNNSDWKLLWSNTDASGAFGEYVMPSSAASNMAEVLSDNLSKTVYIRITAVGGLFCLNRLDFGYTYGLGYTPASSPDNAKISALTVNGLLATDFDSVTNTYNISVPFSTEQINIAVTPENGNATVSGNVGTFAFTDPTSHTYTVTVTSQDSSSSIPYTIIVTRSAQVGTTRMKAADPAKGDPENTEHTSDPDYFGNYYINGGWRQGANLWATFNNDAVFKFTLPSNTTNFEPVIELGISSSEIGPFTIYASKDGNVDWLPVAKMTSTPAENTIYNSTTGLKTHSASYKATEGNFFDQLNTANITAILENNPSKSVYLRIADLSTPVDPYGYRTLIRYIGLTYTFNSSPDNAKISSLTVNGKLTTDFDSVTNTYNVSVPYSTEQINIAVTAEDEEAVISGDIGIFAFTDPTSHTYKVTVTAKDSTHIEYTIIVNRSVQMGIKVANPANRTNYGEDSTKVDFFNNFYVGGGWPTNYLWTTSANDNQACFRFNLPDGAYDFEPYFLGIEPGYSFKVYASNNGSDWLPVAEQNTTFINNKVYNSTVGLNTGPNSDYGPIGGETVGRAFTSLNAGNIAKVLQNNPSKVVYLRVSDIEGVEPSDGYGKRILLRAFGITYAFTGSPDDGSNTNGTGCGGEIFVIPPPPDFNPSAPVFSDPYENDPNYKIQTEFRIAVDGNAYNDGIKTYTESELAKGALQGNVAANQRILRGTESTAFTIEVDPNAVFLRLDNWDYDGPQVWSEGAEAPHSQLIDIALWSEEAEAFSSINSYSWGAPEFAWKYFDNGWGRDANNEWIVTHAQINPETGKKKLTLRLMGRFRGDYGTADDDGLFFYKSFVVQTIVSLTPLNNNNNNNSNNNNNNGNVGTSAKTGTVKGRLVYSEDREALANVVIILNSMPAMFATTDSNGNFEFTDVPPGLYTLYMVNENGGEISSYFDFKVKAGYVVQLDAIYDGEDFWVKMISNSPQTGDTGNLLILLTLLILSGAVLAACILNKRRKIS